MGGRCLHNTEEQVVNHKHTLPLYYLRGLTGQLGKHESSSHIANHDCFYLVPTWPEPWARGCVLKPPVWSLRLTALLRKHYSSSYRENHACFYSVPAWLEPWVRGCVVKPPGWSLRLTGQLRRRNRIPTSGRCIWILLLYSTIYIMDSMCATESWTLIPYWD
jgi:hypothetical protein